MKQLPECFRQVAAVDHGQSSVTGGAIPLSTVQHTKKRAFRVICHTSLKTERRSAGICCRVSPHQAAPADTAFSAQHQYLSPYLAAHKRESMSTRLPAMCGADGDPVAPSLAGSVYSVQNRRGSQVSALLCCVSAPFVDFENFKPGQVGHCMAYVGFWRVLLL